MKGNFSVFEIFVALLVAFLAIFFLIQAGLFVGSWRLPFIK